MRPHHAMVHRQMKSSDSPSRHVGSSPAAIRSLFLVVGAATLSGSRRGQRELPCPWVGERFRRRPAADTSPSARGNHAPVRCCLRFRLLDATRPASSLHAAPQMGRPRCDGSPRQRLPAGHLSPSRRRHSRSPAVSPRQRRGVPRRCPRRRESLASAPWERRARGGGGARRRDVEGRGARRDRTHSSQRPRQKRAQAPQNEPRVHFQAQSPRCVRGHGRCDNAQGR